LERARLLRESLSYQESLERQVKNRTVELEQACRQLNASKQMLEALFQAAPLAIMLLDQQKHVTLWNRGAEQLFGWSHDEVTGRLCPLFNQLSGAEQETLLTQKLNNHELVLLNRLDEKLILQVSTAELAADSANPGNRVLLFKNITEKKHLQIEADRTNRLASLGQLAAGVAHEINNPNGLVLLNMPTLRDILVDALELLNESHPAARVGGLDLARARKIVPQLSDETEDAARRIRQIVEDLKDFASRDARNSSVTFDLNQSAEKALRLVANRIKKATDNFSLRLTAEPPLVYGNPQRIEQVIVNLMVNACESLTARTSALELETRVDKRNGHAILQVMDQGCGIRAEDMKYITDPFFTTRRETGGTGLGLSVSARIAREHAGRLHFESDWGTGTCATLILPLVQEGP
jgi:PAS domain S-box-containing protein